MLSTSKLSWFSTTRDTFKNQRLQTRVLLFIFSSIIKSNILFRFFIMKKIRKGPQFVAYCSWKWHSGWETLIHMTDLSAFHFKRNELEHISPRNWASYRHIMSNGSSLLTTNTYATIFLTVVTSVWEVQEWELNMYIVKNTRPNVMRI